MAQDYAFATKSVGDTLVAVWCGDPSAARVELLVEEMRAIAARNNSRVFMLKVITDPTPVPDAAARAALQKNFAAMRGTLMAAAMVLEKTGIEGTLSRTVLNTLSTVTRQPFPNRVFAVRRDGAVWLGNNGCTTPVTSLMSAAEGLELRLRSQPAA
jgi:hypothetical protein